MRVTLGLYRPGDSLLHRLPASVKLCALFLVGAGSVLIRRWWWAVLILAAVVLLLYLMAGFSLRLALAQLRPMLWLLVFMAIFHVWFTGWQQAVAVIGMLAALVCLAALITLTTTTTALVDTVVRWCGPARRFGVDPNASDCCSTSACAASRWLPGWPARCAKAQIARGNATSLRAFAVPLLVRALRQADALGRPWSRGVWTTEPRQPGVSSSGSGSTSRPATHWPPPGRADECLFGFCS